MLIWQWLSLAILILLAIPLGIIIAKNTAEELKAGRKAFLALMVLSLLVAFIGLFCKISLEEKTLLISVMLFIFIFSSISLCEARKKH